MSGKKIGFWAVIDQAGNGKGGGALWNCICKCGVNKVVNGADLRFGKSTNCGCQNINRLGDSQRTHGFAKTRIYNIFKGMHARCNSGNPNYGGRGISVCKEWDDFVTFKDWAFSNGYSAKLTIERKDVNGSYCPSNCTWADALTQSCNRRFVQKAPDGELWWHKAQKNGITRAAFEWRKSKGWAMEEIVTWPLGKRRFKRSRDNSGKFI